MNQTRPHTTIYFSYKFKKFSLNINSVKILSENNNNNNKKKPESNVMYEDINII